MRRGEVWLVRLDPTVGAEIGKTRPAAIVSDDEVGVLPLKVIVPITEWQERYSDRQWMVQVEPSVENGLNKLSAGDTFQLSCISIERFVRQLGTLSDTAMQEITDALAIVLSIYS
ncbi:type II toxin-antitoxin system PemK/MazF family toxin [Argonema galeatum]|uniref:type II toxin-antitoxin system PemK/MazF family toxin n=1 Tax=Argonema galeatum TaxID=2942762 RepID=UPI002010F81B|nr:type II toxin-antitoxin system PemK/MazF family toxin [Argonema galeatum]MCL1465331.1 type II toxin-antitoxin system PemK/MazF family toxin [Argonema galeatum A003/A1]